MKKGKVTFYSRSRGFGFIECNGESYFFHINETDKSDTKEYFEGDVVIFEATTGERGLKGVRVRHDIKVDE